MKRLLLNAMILNDSVEQIPYVIIMDMESKKTLSGKKYLSCSLIMAFFLINWFIHYFLYVNPDNLFLQKLNSILCLYRSYVVHLLLVYKKVTSALLRGERL